MHCQTTRHFPVEEGCPAQAVILSTAAMRLKCPGTPPGWLEAECWRSRPGIPGFPGLREPWPPSQRGQIPRTIECGSAEQARHRACRGAEGHHENAERGGTGRADPGAEDHHPAPGWAHHRGPTPHLAQGLWGAGLSILAQRWAWVNRASGHPTLHPKTGSRIQGACHAGGRIGERRS